VGFARQPGVRQRRRPRKDHGGPAAEYFNASNTNNTFDNRSDDKGPEPEGLAVATINGRTYVFVGLERISGIAVYDVTNPYAPRFANYFDNRNFAGDPEAGTAGDLGPEGLVFIDPQDSPTGTGLLVVANEVSGTTTLYGVSKPAAVESFTLVNADTDSAIAPLTDGSVIDYARLATTRLNIRARVSPDTVGSVVFELNGKVFATENIAEYLLAGNDGPDYKAWTPGLGQYTLKATPYTGAGGQGTAGVPLLITFKVVNSATVGRLVLVNARTGADLREIKDGDVVNLRTLPGRQVNARAETQPDTVGSVVFRLKRDDNPEITQTENIVPYSLFGNVGPTAEYQPYRLRPGTYRLQIIPYAEARGKGAPGDTTRIAFTVVDEPAVRKLLLVDVDKDKVLTEIKDGDVLDPLALGISANSRLNIQAETSPGRVEKVIFDLNGNAGYYSDDRRPYELFGNQGLPVRQVAPGRYSLKATPYYKAGGVAKAGTPLTVQFTVPDTAQTGASPAKVAAAAGKPATPERQTLNVTVSPNPVKDVLTIRFAAPVTGPVAVKVYDILGRKAYHEEQLPVTDGQQLEVDLSALPARFYLLKVRTGAGTRVIRIVKE
jgi:hypothetical protein